VASALVTERLELQPYRLEDVERIHAVLYGDEESMRLIGGVLTIDKTRAEIERYIGFEERDGYSPWAVIERATGDLVGEAGLKPWEDVGPEVEIGYAFGAPWWGRGYATEAGHRILEAAFETHGLKRVVAVTSDENVGSQRVIAKLGLKPAGRREAYGRDLLYCELDRP
jgi:ribosomal-protein-alanine N-acetyltransferase